MTGMKCTNVNVIIRRRRKVASSYFLVLNLTNSLFSASGKDVPALSPWKTVGAPSLGCVTERARSPAWPEEEKDKGQSVEEQAHDFGLRIPLQTSLNNNNSLFEMVLPTPTTYINSFSLN